MQSENRARVKCEIESKLKMVLVQHRHLIVFSITMTVLWPHVDMCSVVCCGASDSALK